MGSKRVSQIFKILFQTGDINIFVTENANGDVPLTVKNV